MAAELTLYQPLKNARVTQGFGFNANGSYAADGLMGHTGIDLVTFAGDTVLFSQYGNVYKIVNKDNPDLSKFRAVFQLVQGKEFWWELCYGHANAIYAKHGITPWGVPCISEGNTGLVYANGNLVSNADKARSSTAGTHLHFQVRKCIRTKEEGRGQYLSSEQDGSMAYKDSEGFLYWVPDFDNGYNGCVDPALFLVDTYAGDARTALFSLRDLLLKLKSLLGKLTV